MPELYAVFPFGQYGLGKPDLQVAIDTARLAPETDEQLTHISWHQQGIQYARLGMVPEAMEFLLRKLGNAEQRTPVFWGPGHDWTPDHNWGGSGMIQLQEMLLQAEGDKIYLFPCWDRAHRRVVPALGAAQHRRRVPSEARRRRAVDRNAARATTSGEGCARAIAVRDRVVVAA